MRLPVLIGSGHTVATLSYDKSDPYAVAMRVTDTGGPVEWVFARDLLADALDHGRAGVGDLVVIARGDLVVLSLSTPDGTGAAVFRRDDVTTFVARAQRIVPPGRESGFLDWSDLPEVRQ